MRIRNLHDWNLSPALAVALQRKLADQIDTRSPLRAVRLVAGADVSYSKFSNQLFAGVVVLELPELAVVETSWVQIVGRFPYVPGLLSFREAPPLLEAFRRLDATPDVVLVDGQGLAHPRRMGLACHLGLFLDLPTIGCAKSLLIGRHRKLGDRVGAVARLMDQKDVVGMAVRTRRACKPIYVSVGHKADLASAVRLVLTCGKGYRLPEPTRQAHLLVNAVRRGE